MAELSPLDQVKFKAVLSVSPPKDVQAALDTLEQLDSYELSYYSDSAGVFFKDYLRRFMDSRFDSKWLDTLLTQNEGERLLQRLGAAETPYGVISACGRSLYEIVPCDEPETKELKTQTLANEKLDVIEVLDRKALFSNGRLMPEEIPEGLYVYDLRHSDDGSRFISIEPKVGVNHGGTVLMKEILDFGNIYAFEHEGLTNLLFPFNDSAALDMGRLAIWRLCSHEQFGGTWLSDYVPNRLSDFTEDEAENIDEGMVM